MGVFKPAESFWIDDDPEAVILNLGAYDEAHDGKLYLHHHLSHAEGLWLMAELAKRYLPDDQPPRSKVEGKDQ